MKTYTARPSEIESRWYLIDAEGQTLGRLAANIARLLRGKHKPTYTPHLNTGDHVVVVNASRVRVTGSKGEKKIYTRYTGYPDGLRQRTYNELAKIHPTAPLEHAVKGMLQHNTLGADMLRRLRVYAGPSHRHTAQQPLAIRFGSKGEIETIGR
jgi:large subunit ribosomal protein L13